MGADAEELQVVVPQIVGAPIQSAAWISEAIFDPVASATAGIWRYRGDGWSAVLKLLHHSDVGSPMWLSGESESHWFYWRREALAYESGLLDAQSGSLRAPRCYGVFHREDGTIAVWLEDLAGTRPAAEWTIERYGVAAKHLGAAQAAWVNEPADVDRAWLSHGWLREYVDRRAPMMDGLAILASASVKYLWILPALLASVRSELPEINHRPAAETIAAWAPAIPKVVELGERAIALAAAFNR